MKPSVHKEKEGHWDLARFRNWVFWILVKCSANWATGALVLEQRIYRWHLSIDTAWISGWIVLRFGKSNAELGLVFNFTWIKYKMKFSPRQPAKSCFVHLSGRKQSWWHQMLIVATIQCNVLVFVAMHANILNVLQGNRLNAVFGLCSGSKHSWWHQSCSVATIQPKCCCMLLLMCMPMQIVPALITVAEGKSNFPLRASIKEPTTR